MSQLGSSQDCPVKVSSIVARVVNYAQTVHTLYELQLTITIFILNSQLLTF